MKTYTCQCGARLHFENSRCVNCQSELGFLPDALTLSALTSIGDQKWQASSNHRLYRKCRNHRIRDVCNWMIPEQDTHAFCFSCRLSEIIPDLSNPHNTERWFRIEQAKRRLIYSLLWLELPVISKQDDSLHGLAFHLLADKNQGFSEFARATPMQDRVITGHRCGIITLNIAEADPVLREQSRASMHEAYRTLLGHFRHESGHYYWDLLLRNSPRVKAFRNMFGDERMDYDSVIQGYYRKGPIANWQENWISAYASAHPWEDWAETWAHYLHMIDTLETASDYGFSMGDKTPPSANRPQFSARYLSTIAFHDLVCEWRYLTVALNDMNRCMGLEDAYPFVLSDAIIEKLAFVHETIILSPRTGFIPSRISATAQRPV